MISRRVAALAFVGLVAGCSKSAPTGFGPGLGSAEDDDQTSGILTTGIEPTNDSGSAAPTSADADAGTDAEASDAAASDADEASVGSDEAGTSDDPGSTGSSPATTDASASGSGTPDEPPGDPLDPDLDVPEDGEACDTPGSLVECPGIAVCRFATSEQGICESCEPCGNLGNLCSESSECDILFSCFEGRCTNFCQLGTFECGPVEDCLDIGHPTYGVCDPSAL